VEFNKHYLYPHFQIELQRRWALPNKLSEWYTVSKRNKTIWLAIYFIYEPQTNSEVFFFFVALMYLDKSTVEKQN